MARELADASSAGGKSAVIESSEIRVNLNTHTTAKVRDVSVLSALILLERRLKPLQPHSAFVKFGNYYSGSAKRATEWRDRGQGS